MTKELQLEQLNKKTNRFRKTANTMPADGWIRATRKALGMSLRQLSQRMGITEQSLSELEKREKNGNISLKSLRDAARAMNLNLSYGFFNEKQDFNDLIESQAKKKAEQIVKRTNHNMAIEGQDTSKRFINKEIKKRTASIVRDNLRILWD